MTRPSDEARRKLLTAAFWMPSVQTMMSRTSSITNAFVNAIIPVKEPSIDEIEQALAILKMDAADVRCAYCGDKATEWDHLRPLVLKQRPTGYISEIANLVPSCGKCNQSKGNKDWRKWMVSQARWSPTGRQVPNVPERLALLEAYERWQEPLRLDFEAILGGDSWSNYWTMWKALLGELGKCQEVANAIRDRVTTHLGQNSND